jgi:hypothetical protein
MSAVFISYRRETSAGEARALFNELAARLGKSSVFMDVDSIALGRDFRSILQKTLETCDLMLVVIGKNWVEIKDEQGKARLRDPNDFVRMEVEAALKRDIVVTPVLVQGARMPTAEQLPTEIGDFAYRSAFELSHNRWGSDVEEMIRRLDIFPQERKEQIETDHGSAPNRPKQTKSSKSPIIDAYRLEAGVGRELGGDTTLRQAWLRFGALDLAALNQQRSFRRTEGQTLALSVGVTATVILYQAVPDRCAIPFSGLEFGCGHGLHYLVIIAPIALSVLIGGTNRFQQGRRWVLTRQAAEAMKREIFQFRTGAALYRNEATREKNLAKAVEHVTRRLAGSEANTMALPIYSGPIPPQYADDDGMSPLSPDRYIEVRLDDHLQFFHMKAVMLGTLLKRLQSGILGVGGLGALLAAIGFDLWVTLTTAIATALATYLSYRGVDSTLTNYNQTAIDLENIKGWWTALRPDEQADSSNVDALVQHTEQALAPESGGWTLRTQDC